MWSILGELCFVLRYPMIVCLVHIRVSVAPGEVVPDIRFKSRWLNTEENSKKQFSSLAELHVQNLAGTEYASISPMKPSKTKAEQPRDISLQSLSDFEKGEIANKLRGEREFREITVKTYNKAENKDANNSEDLTTDLHEKPSHKLDREGLKKRTAEKKKHAERDNDGKADRSYAEAVVSETTQELLRRSSNSISSSKDDKEISEILHMSAVVASATSSRPSSSLDFHSSRAGSEGQCKSPPVSGVKIPFFSGNPAVEITHGMIQLYKSNYIVTVNDDEPPPATDTLCMLAVPGTVDTHTILEFTAAYCDTIKRLRIVRDRTPSQYMAIITFSSEESASEFFHTFNNVPFSSLTQDEICRLAFVASVDALPALHAKSPSVAGDSVGLLPILESTELPDCVLCLERMDESVRGVLTILCNHSFHGSCLQKWEDLCCPVCRYIQTPEPKTNNKCLMCGSQEDLWICLVCGHVGCGRYTSEHAQQHYLETHHNYAMALSDNRVWDYAGDYFVHRLFQNKEDGKLVEQKDPEQRESKIEAIQLECMYLLTSQLDSQRKYWEEKLSDVEGRATMDLESAKADLTNMQTQCELIRNKFSVVEKEKTHLEKKNQQLASKYSQSLRDLSTERELNSSLQKNQEEWRKKVQDLEQTSKDQQGEIAELKEQLRDVMFYLEAHKTISEADEKTREEAQAGQIIVGAAGGQRRKKKNKKS